MRIEVYNQLGKLIKILDDSNRQDGKYKLEWIPGANANGIYYIKLITDDSSIIKKTILIK